METTPGREDYHVAIFCALGTESEAVEGAFDEVFDTCTRNWQKADNDNNTYTTGRIGRHNVVLVFLPGIGKVNAATCSSNACATFRNLKLALVVGVSGGSPFVPGTQEPIYLGDVVVSTQILQIDFGRDTVDGFVPKLSEEGNVKLPPLSVSSFIHKLKGKRVLASLKEKTKAYMVSSQDYAELALPSSGTDSLFPTDYLHKHHSSTNLRECKICDDNPALRCQRSEKLSCRQLQCDTQMRQRDRQRRVTEGPCIFFGPICSSDTVIKNGVRRDAEVERHSVLAFEMEGAGVHGHLPTLIIKGICDYADSHKNKRWQPYSAITAASCCKAILEEWDSRTAMSQRQSILDARNTQRSFEGVQGSREKTKRNVLASLHFSQSDFRETNIKLAHPRTCQWIFNSPEFHSWLDSKDSSAHHRVLWIRGKPGSGKSTLLKHILLQNKKFLSGYSCAHYFFHARGTELQRSRLGMLRSLLHQLVEQNFKLLDRFVGGLPSREYDSLETKSWSIEQLEQILLQSATDVTLANTLLIVDALDECERDDARAIATFFEDLAARAIHAGSALQICISIRYFPNIGITKCVRLNLDERTEHRADLDLYISEKLRIKEEPIATQLSEKANHVFLWAVLVVRNLNAAYDEGADADTLRELLANTPKELSEVFKGLLGPPVLIPPSTVFMLQLVLFSLTPLGIQALYQLTMAHADSEKVRGWSESGMTNPRARAFVITASRGLLEIVPTSKMIVQFIHESVRDYLCDGLGSFVRQTHASFQSFVSSSHRAIFEACICSMEAFAQKCQWTGFNFVESCLEGNFTPFSNNMTAIDEKFRDKPQQLKTDWPNIEYASIYMLHHLARVRDPESLRHLVPKYSRLFERTSSTRYSRLFETSFHPMLQDGADKALHQIMKLHCLPTNRSHGDADVELTTLLDAFLANMSIGSMKRGAPHRVRYEYALKEAVAFRWPGGLRTLLNFGASLGVDNICVYDILETTLEGFRGYCKDDFSSFDINIDEFGSSDATGQVELWESLVKVALRAIIDIRNPSEETFRNGDMAPLVIACQYGTMELIMLAMDAGFDVNTKDFEGRNPLDVAVQAHRVGVVKFLLANGAVSDEALDLAVKTQDEKVVRLLIDTWTHDAIDRTEWKRLLMKAIENGHLGVIRHLLLNAAETFSEKLEDNEHIEDAAERLGLSHATTQWSDEQRDVFAVFHKAEPSLESDLRDSLLALLTAQIAKTKHDGQEERGVFDLSSTHLLSSAPPTGYLSIHSYKDLRSRVRSIK